MKTIFPTRKPKLTKEFLKIPDDIIFDFRVHGLSPREFWYLMINETTISEEVEEKELKEWKKSLLQGSRTTIWRVRKSLKKKGYL